MLQTTSVPHVLREAYLVYRRIDPPASVLLNTLKALVENSVQSFIVIDALDECPKTDGKRDNLLETLQKISRFTMPQLHLLVTSRAEEDITHAINAMPKFEVESVSKSLVDRDIVTYVKQELGSDPTMKGWPQDIKAKVEYVLTTKSNGM
jgi:hypothetical protein